MTLKDCEDALKVHEGHIKQAEMDLEYAKTFIPVIESKIKELGEQK